MGKRWSTKLILIIGIGLLAPVFVYTVFQFTQRDYDEALIQKIYNRQLNTILFSVNTHCYDVFESRASKISARVSNTAGLDYNEIVETMQEFIDTYPSINGIILNIKGLDDLLIYEQDERHPRDEINITEDLQRFHRILAENQSEIEKLIRYSNSAGYAQPFAVNWVTTQASRITCHIFSISGPGHREEGTGLAAFLIDDMEFIENIVAHKFAEMDEGNFIFAVKDREADDFIYLTDDNPGSSFELIESLWVIDDLDLMIKLRGKTLDAISTSRTQRNLLFLVLVNVVLVLGLMVLFRNISMEMGLAQMKTDFVANVSHELRTPLALIRMNAETLEMGRVASEEKKHHYYRTIMNESTRLTQLINNILDFSRIESQRKKYNMIELDLALLVEETLNVYRYHFEQKGFIQQSSIDEGLPKVRVDAEAVRLAFVNLLDNAMKFSTDRKEVNIQLKQDGAALVLSVTDFGIGIAEGEQKKIFEKFYRAGSSLVHNTKGSGLGLSLVKHIMNVHNGRIKVISKSGEGSTFSLIFPVQRS